MNKETRFLANKPVSSLRLVFDKLKHHFFGRINGAIYGYRLLGTSGIRTGYNSLNIRPGTYFYMDLGATINFEGSLSIGHFVRSNIPLPGLSRSGLVLLKNSIFEAEDNVKLATGAHIHLGSNSRLRIGRNTYIGHNSQIVVKELIEIGRDCAISWNASILDTNLHELDSSANSKAIKIGDHVWIGASVTILSGVEIGDGAVVAAGSIVTKNIPPRALAAGNPARVIRTEVNWK